MEGKRNERRRAKKVYSDYSVEVDSQKCYIPRRAGVTVQKNLDIALL